MGIWAFGIWCSEVIPRSRVDPEDEHIGLNVAEHGAKTVWLDTMKTMQHIVQTCDLTARAEVNTVQKRVRPPSLSTTFRDFSPAFQ